MARVRVLYWKEIPVQVQASDDSGQASRPLDPRFQHAVDSIAMFDGSAGSDAYLAAWEWSGYKDVAGSARDAADSVARLYEQRMPADLAAVIRDAQRAGTRDPRPGSLDRMVSPQTDRASTQSGNKQGQPPVQVKKSRLLERLAAGDILISDGATGTYLQTRGLEPGGAPELLNVTKPDLIRQMARDYFDAGSDLVLTNTFGANVFRLKMHGLEQRTRELNRSGAELAREAAPTGRFVVGSVGPTGAMLTSLGGDAEEAQVYDSYAEQIAALEEGGADAVVIETQIVLQEALIAARAARENTALPVFSTMTFDKGPLGYFTMAGQTPEAAAAGLINAGIDVAGTNCGNGIDRMVEIAAKMRSVTPGLLWVKSNAGIPKFVRGQAPVYPESPQYMAERFEVLARLPVNVLGGCCGTTPAHIRALADVVHGKGLRAHTTPAPAGPA